MSLLGDKTGGGPSRDFWLRMSSALRFPLRQGGAIQIAIAIVAIIASGSCACCWTPKAYNIRVFHVMMYVVTTGVFGYVLNYLAHVCNEVAGGADILPAWPEYSGFVESALKPTFTMLGSIAASTALGIITLVVGAITGSSAIMFGAVLLLGLGLLIYPIIFLHASRFDDFIGLSFRSFKVIGERPLEYMIVVMCAGIVPMPTVLGVIGLANHSNALGMLAVLLGFGLSAYMSAIYAYAAGLFYYCHQDLFPD